jgi:hypothetical protein
MFVEIRCADPGTAFRGNWSGIETPAQILTKLRETSQRLGLPIQVSIEREGVWSIAPTGKVIQGRLFDEEKLSPPSKKRRRPIRSERGARQST